MLLSTILYSVDPLAASLMNGQNAPFLFSACLQAGQLAAYGVFACAAFPNLLLNPDVRRSVTRWILNMRQGGILLALGTLSGLDYVFYLYCAQVTDIAVAAILSELWILFAVPIGWALARNRKRYRRPSAASMLCIAAACAGAALVMAGQSSLTNQSGMTTHQLLLGGTLGLLSALAVAAAVSLFRWSEELVARLPRKAVQEYGNTSLELFATSIAICLTGALSTAMNTGAGAVTSESIQPAQAAGAAALGALVYFGASILWRAANIVTIDLSVNALTSFTPIIALGWIWAWRQAALPGGETILSVPRADLLAAGAVTITTANLLLQYFRSRMDENT